MVKSGPDQSFQCRAFGTGQVFATLIGFSLLAGSCTSFRSSNQVAPSGVVVVNAPSQGEVRRILVTEGSPVTAGMPILDIVMAQPGAPPQVTQDPQAQARNQYRAAEGEIATAQLEVQRTAIEVQRVTALVANGGAPQSQLDAAQAQYQRAQEQLQQAKQAVQGAQSGLVYQEGKSAPGSAAPNPQMIIQVRAPSDGVLSVLNAKPGQHVTIGQPLATIRTNR
jgi:multidrug efflux pump subunit AcrA (membrane-fusion protein)